MIGKFMEQANADLQAEVLADEPNRWIEIARSVALGFDDIHVSDVKVPNGGVHFWIHLRNKKVNGFQVWVTRAWEDKDEGKRVGERTLYLEWHESVVDGIDNGKSEGKDDTVGIVGDLLKLFVKGRKGVPGYATYVRYAQAFSAAIVRAEPSARIRTTISQ